MDQYQLIPAIKNRKPLFSVEKKEEFIYNSGRAEALVSFYQRGYSDKVTKFATSLELEAYKLGWKVAAIKRATNKDFYSIGLKSLLDGPSVCKELKKHRQFGFLNSFEDKEEGFRDDHDSNQKLDNYDDIFPYEECFPWREDDPRDIENSFKDVNPQERALESFRREFRKILSEIDDITWDDEMMKILSSKEELPRATLKRNLEGSRR
jgi:hypothetical protein